MLDKKQMTEEDIKLNFITPALIFHGWEHHITMETKVEFTAGQINIQGNVAQRKAPKKADYVLYLTRNYPIAIVEAKDNTHGVSDGLQQAMTYARMMDVPFAYASNGDAFFEHDFLTGAEREIALEDFPTPEELRARLERGANDGEGLNTEEKRLLSQPYYSGQQCHPPRYYQQNAVNRTLSAIARGQNRILLVMATGTGKTYTAFQIVFRLLKSGLKKKILYLADRNILVDQSIQQDFAPLDKTIHKVNFNKDDPSTVTAYEVYFSLYQQLSDRSDDSDDEDADSDETLQRLSRLFKPDFFDLVIVDECHRGSAKKDSSWRKILEYFSSATQLGMTATPKETRDASNIDYFGKPVYTYSLRNGVEDGFLAPFRVVSIHTNVSEEWRPTKGQLDKNGQEIEDRIYNNSDYDRTLILEDRIRQVAQEITNYLKYSDRMQKTIVFCQSEEHAERMRVALVNLNQDMVRENPDYVVRITGSDDYGKSKLSYFISVGTPYPVIATTSKLLSTGVDCKMTKLIVLDQMIGSMTEFKQIIGRGTRIREQDGKLYFELMDFRGNVRHFADPDWDGTPEKPDPNYPPKPKPTNPTPPPPPPEKPDPPEKPKKYIVTRSGCRVETWGKVVAIYDPHGKLLRQENIIDYTKTNVLGQFASLEKFIQRWNSAEKKESIRDLLRLEFGIDLEALKAEQNMTDVDDFDFLCHIAFDKKPLTRRERANNVKKRDFLSRYSGTARDVLETLLEMYMNEGIYELDSPTDVLKLPIFQRFGTPSRIAVYFGGRDGYLRAVRELENELYNAG